MPQAHKFPCKEPLTLGCPTQIYLQGRHAQGIVVVTVIYLQVEVRKNPTRKQFPDPFETTEAGCCREVGKDHWMMRRISCSLLPEAVPGKESRVLFYY